MIDPCEKERKEYEIALDEELKAKAQVDLPLQPLGVKTPPPSDINAIKTFQEKENIRKLKFQILQDCKELHNQK